MKTTTIDTSTVNDPKDYIIWLKTQPIFMNGELDGLPTSAIVMHDSLIEEHLSIMGYGPRTYKIIRLGTTDPIVLYHVIDVELGFQFLISGGLPGISGITTQAAELMALGVKQIVHIGTCGLLGDTLEAGSPILSNGAVPGDGSDRYFNNSFFNPDPVFFEFARQMMDSLGMKHQVSTGFTIPIFYYQPKAIIIDLLCEDEFKPVGYVEMEQSGFFAVASLNKVEALSFVTGSDRYTIQDGELKHTYYDIDENESKLAMLRFCILLLKAWSEEGLEV